MKRAGFEHLCGVSAALDVVGDRWALLVVRELLFSSKRFGDLLRGLPGIGTNTLTTRLAELEASGVLTKRTTPPPLAVTAYELTERGRALTPTLCALARWGSGELVGAKPTHTMQPAWLGLALLAYFDAAAAPRTPMEVALVFPEGALAITLGPSGVDIAERAARAPDLTLRASSPDLVLALVRRATSIAAATKKGTLTLEGDRACVATFLASFPLG